MDFIKFNVDRQRLYYSQKRYFSTDTIDTLYCKFEFATDRSGNIRGEWNLPYLWTQFHDKNGNVYVKPVKDNVCSIPHDCLRQSEFKMTLFATDTEDYMVCKKRYTTNEILFLFNGQANLDYNGGVDPDEPVPSQWEILLDRVDECENRVNEMSQDVSVMGDRVDTFDSRITTNENDIEELNTRLENETTARENADTNLQSLIADETTARENADADLRLLINDEVNERASGDNALQNSINALDTRVTTNENAIEGINTTVDDLSDTVELLYKTLKKANSWAELAELVRSGKASQFLNYGDQIEEDWVDVDNGNKEYSNPWDVAKFEDVETREGIIKGMFLNTHWATLRPIQFSHNRAFYACRDGLSAGTYHITLGADWGTNAKKDKSYQFTITNDVPVGGKLAGFYSMPDVVPSNWKVYVYDANGIDILENAIAVTEGTDGTSLGTLKLNTRDGNLNSMQETGYGNNDWETSAYRQYLNSREGKGAWWIAQDEWDIAPDQLNTVSGFLCGISDELYDSMQTVKVKTWKNNSTYGGVESYTYDKVFLPSKEELYYTPQKAGEGTYYPLMKEQLGLDSPLADYTAYAPNITYAIENHSSAQYVRLRSANLISANSVWNVSASGYVNHGNAAYAHRCTPVCVIG